MNQRPCGNPESFSLDQLENVTDANYTDVQTKITDSLGNMTEKLKAEQTRLTEAGKDDRAEELGQRITDLQNLSTNVSKASTAAELKEVVFTYMKTQAVDSLEKEVEHLQVKVNESENTIDGNMSDKISSRITELTSLIEDLNGAKSLGDLKEIMSSSPGISGVGGDNRMHHGGCGCPIGPGRMQDNSTDA
jgi:L-lactate utilization protein LutC